MVGNSQVAQSPAGAKGLLFLPYLLGERSPHWNPEAKGTFIGITVEHSKGDMLRAVLEGVSLNLSVVLDLYKSRNPVDKVTIYPNTKNAMKYQKMKPIFDEAYHSLVNVYRQLAQV